MRFTDPRPGRVGFTLVELVVAVTVLAVGLLGLSATAGVVASRMNAALLETRVTTRAQAALEGLLAGEPDVPSTGEAERGRLETSWLASGAGLREVRVVVEGRLAGSDAADTLVTLACGR